MIPLITLNSGSKIPQVGLGTWQAKPEEVKRAVEAAVSVGVRHIDCAAVYQNEAEVGEALQAKMKDGTVTRGELFITSKLWNTKHRPEDVKPALEKTLGDLQLSYLDLYLMHWPVALKAGPDKIPLDADGNALFEDVDFVDTWKAMEKCVNQGLVKNIGVSNFNESQIQRIIDNCAIKPAMNQVEIHPFLDQRRIIKFCHSHDITVTAFSPFASPGRRSKEPGDPNVFECEVIQDVAESMGKSAAQVALRFLIQQNCVVIPKSVTPERIKQNLQVFDFELSSDDMERIQSLNKTDFRLCSAVWWKNSPYYPF